MNKKIITSFEQSEPKKYTVIAQEDSATGDIILPFPEEILKQLDWRAGDVLNWDDSDLSNGIKITNKTLEERIDENGEKIFIVEAISQFKMKYAIRGKSLEHAFDTVTCEEAEELDQEWLGETIFSGREISKEEFLKDKSVTAYRENWSEEKKLSLIHKINYKD